MTKRSRENVSVIVPVFNGEKYLAEALQSILDQTFAAAEIIVVDDGSVDGSREVAGRFSPRVRCIRQKRGGAAAARNLGIDRANGDFLAFLDADDLWLPDKLEKQLAMLRGPGRFDMVFGGVEQFLATDLDNSSSSNRTQHSLFFTGLHVGTLLAGKAVFKSVGYFSDSLRVGEFIDWYARARDMGFNIGLLAQVVMRRRIHAANMMKHAEDIGGQYARILKDSLMRRRRLPNMK